MGPPSRLLSSGLKNRVFAHALTFTLGIATFHSLSVWSGGGTSRNTLIASDVYTEARPVLRNPSQQYQCKFYLAESAVAPNSGMGIFAGTGLMKGDVVGFPDICIFVSDAPDQWTHLSSHTFGWASFFGQYEGRNSRAACEGFHTTFNTMPMSQINTKLISPIQATTAGVKRSMPAAGSFSHHYGIHAVALDVVSAGSELTIDYGDWEFEEDKQYVLPRRAVDELAAEGWCIDNLEIRESTIAGAGRGAFVKRPLQAHATVAPAPLQAFRDRKIFQKTTPEQLYVNYCLQPADSDMIFYPYGPGVNLINHSPDEANVYLRWSENHMHKKHLLDMEYDTFWEEVTPGALVLEVAAIRDLVPGEELFLNYGDAFDRAWNKHVAKWQPPKDADEYVYPEEMDETEMLRTQEEQEEEPYPGNLVLMCNTPDWERQESRHIEWYEADYEWAEGMVYCFILDRKTGSNGLFEYTVEVLLYNRKLRGPNAAAELNYDPKKPFKDRFVDTKVPRRAIRWAERPYQDDEHLPNSFRQPIGFPKELVPQSWKRTSS